MSSSNGKRQFISSTSHPISGGLCELSLSLSNDELFSSLGISSTVVKLPSVLTAELSALCSTLLLGAKPLSALPPGYLAYRPLLTGFPYPGELDKRRSQEPIEGRAGLLKLSPFNPEKFQSLMEIVVPGKRDESLETLSLRCLDR